MSRLTSLPLSALVLFAACGPKSPDAGTDPNAPKVEEAPKVAHVMGFEMGRAVDSTNTITGGIRTTFTPTDTIVVSVTTQYVGLGAKVEAHLMQDTTKLASLDAAATAPDTAGRARVSLKFASPKAMKLGHYQMQLLLDGAVQMSKDLEITKDGEAATAAAAPAEKPAAKPATKGSGTKGTGTKPPAKGGGK